MPPYVSPTQEERNVMAAPENLLRHETSPYLLQHADNPVHWRPWGTAALEEARAEKKPILLSIGYAACHWCHVMAHESFEDPATAALMNERFVNIKVDREERPDIDHLYMSALHALGEQGGWPLTMFIAPDVLGRHLLPARATLGAALVPPGADRRVGGVPHRPRDGGEEHDRAAPGAGGDVDRPCRRPTGAGTPRCGGGGAAADE
jgi:hypothetical protein